MKQILVVHFSQTGQLSEAVTALVKPLADAGHHVTHEMLKPVAPFPFPWSIRAFLDAFPESVQLDPAPIMPLQVAPDARFDLIILGYQVWYLSPAQPMVAFLKSEEAVRLIRGKPVVTLVACRNMWLMAQEKMKDLITSAGGELRDHVALTDPPEHALQSFITTPRWLLTGRRNGFWGMPAAGIPVEHLRATSRFGSALAAALNNDDEVKPRPMLAGLGAAPVQAKLIISERTGHRAFSVWSRFIHLVGKPGSALRQPVLIVFAVYLVAMIMTVVPVSLLLQRLLAPVLSPALRRRQLYFEAPSGSAEFNLSKYDHH